ncbi:uncharacterized protein PITG_01676 [Phytophthora infestans T30-4]|uniref:Uncharacterized protein n=1 Tax=Phytophthora infestans (strain T30-4) TaxID=403677 RepID=D0MTT3_PHYIT|nr:uncharacterized protein PITG_01676 [Phytophthora infestans T30-4]EEY61380.1 conserved hypothetical protein [Phytophthora infestans T30-4]|eukprot:XP_002908297.1 conserved hypothetical protein [Phytophthora infestans T30-4]
MQNMRPSSRQYRRLPPQPTKKCAFINCVNPELSQTDPCSVCDREVHHLCSTDLHDSGHRSVRFCSDACVAAWKTKNPPPEVMPSTKDQLDAFDAAGWSPGAPHQQNSQSSITESGTLELSCSQSSEETTPPGSQVWTHSYGIPLDVHHYRHVGKRDSVWDVAHILATPIGSRTSVSCARRMQPVSLTLQLTHGSEGTDAGAIRLTPRITWSPCTARTG